MTITLDYEPSTSDKGRQHTFLLGEKLIRLSLKKNASLDRGERGRYTREKIASLKHSSQMWISTLHMRVSQRNARQKALCWD
jgi:hypothetical protein